MWMAAAARRGPDVDQRRHVRSSQQRGNLIGIGGAVPERHQHLGAILSRGRERTGRLAGAKTVLGPGACRDILPDVHRLFPITPPPRS
jgi:hypothetical protein